MYGSNSLRRFQQSECLEPRLSSSQSGWDKEGFLEGPSCLWGVSAGEGVGLPHVSLVRKTTVLIEVDCKKKNMFSPCFPYFPESAHVRG